jgi:ribosome modulation factor
MLIVRQQGHASGHDPYADGVQACIAGVPPSECPYAPASVEERDWLLGWEDEAATASE